MNFLLLHAPMSSNESEEIVLISSRTQSGNQEKEDSDSNSVNIEIINKKECSKPPAKQKQNNRRRTRRKLSSKDTQLQSTNRAKEESIPERSNIVTETLHESLSDKVVTETPIKDDAIYLDAIGDSINHSTNLNVSMAYKDQEKNNTVGNVNPGETIGKIGEFLNQERVSTNKIICRDGDRERVYYLKHEDTLEMLYEDFSSEAKLKYKGVFVSKYLTLEDLDYTPENNIFEVIGNDRKMIRLHINLDSSKGIDLTVDPDLPIGALFKRFEIQPDKENLLVINGYVLDVNLTIKEILEDEDVIDYV